MASPLQLAVSDIQLNNYSSLVVIAAVGYDYILTFSKEIEYIWNKPWTLVSTLFVLARYFGLCFTVCLSFWGTSFLPGPEKMYGYVQCLHWSKFLTRRLHFNRCSIIKVLGAWTFWIFVCAADLVMVLRVRILYHRSRFKVLILGTLFMLFAMEVVSFLVYCITVSAGLGSGFTVGTGQVLQFSFCVSTDLFSAFWPKALAASFQISLGALMCLLMTVQFFKELLRQMRVTKHWRLNQYMKRLARDGMIYFIVVLLFALLAVLYYDMGNDSTDGWAFILTGVLQQIPPVTLVPRFILDLRELYMRDFQGGRESNIDTAFGFGSEVGHGSVRSTIVFAGPRENAGNEGDGDMQMEGWMDGAHHTSSSAC